MSIQKFKIGDSIRIIASLPPLAKEGEEYISKICTIESVRKSFIKGFLYGLKDVPYMWYEIELKEYVH